MERIAEEDEEIEDEEKGENDEHLFEDVENTNGGGETAIENQNNLTYAETGRDDMDVDNQESALI